MVKSNFKYCFTLVLFGSVFFNGYTQGTFTNEDFLYDRQFRFSLAAVLNENLKIENVGVRHLRSKPVFNFEVAITRYQHLINDFGFSIGLGFGLAPYNFSYDIITPTNSLFYTNQYYSYEVLDLNANVYYKTIFTFPFSINKIIRRQKKFDLNVEIGAKYNVPVINLPDILHESFYGIFINPDQLDPIKLLNLELSEGANRNIFSFFSKVGLIKANHKLNTFMISLVIHWSPSNLANGTYAFSNLGYESYGKVRQTLNYVGLEVTKGFTTRKRLR